MARITDDNKLIAIKKALIKIIIKDGFTNASIAKVAKEAKVSVGYLYRHYESKESLIFSIYIEKFKQLNQILLQATEKNNAFSSVIFNFYQQIIKMLKSEEDEVLFLFKMITDYSVKISDQMRVELQENIAFIQEKFKEEIHSGISGEQIYIQILGNILFFINLRKRGVFTTQKITTEDIELLTQTTINALK